MASLPYLASPGSIKTALERIRSAATPDRVTVDFITTKLQLKGGTGFAILPYLKKIGFVGTDGSPTDLYKRFRNSASAGAAVADAIKIGYRDLLQVNEYFYELDDKKLLDLIIQVTGAESNSNKSLKPFADFESQLSSEPIPSNKEVASSVVKFDSQGAAPVKDRLGLNLSYTINLNLPATSDQAVFNAIFRSLKEHLLSNDE
jgi:hypothetical protein